MQINEFYSDDLDEGIHDPHIFKAIFMAGPPGAGKNRVIADLDLQYSGLRLQDTDITLYAIKKLKNDIEGFQQPSDEDRRYSLNKTEQRRAMLQQNMLGILINTTGRDSDGIRNLDKQLKSAGYDTFMLFVDVDYAIAFDRIKDREENATNPWDRRKVDEPYFNDAYDNSKANMDFYALMFGNQFALVTNNVEKQPVVTEDITSDMEYKETLNKAAKRVSRFLRKPLTPTAQQIVDLAKQNTRRP